MSQRDAGEEPGVEGFDIATVSSGNSADHRAPVMDPVFVLCVGRSGSTLLRLLLDTHPTLACPPETNMPALCSQLAVVWSLIEGAPLSLQRGDEPPTIPDAAIAGIRRTMDDMTVPYLRRRGKARYCDKSLGTARYAELLLRIYPGARFVCLYRHPMDVISSGLEACPWGLNGYGFDPYIADTPGNAVMALARFWLDGAAAIAAVEERHPETCHRVRYEELVRDPERVAAGIFDFLCAEPAPGIAQQVFNRDHERFGPADHKIWHTSAISEDSVGRSAAVPVGLIPPPIVESINELLETLGYVAVDEAWGTADMPSSLLTEAGDPPASPAAASSPGADVLVGRLASGLAGADDSLAARWGERISETFTVVIRDPHDSSPVSWVVSPAQRTVIREDELVADDEYGEPDWAMVGTAQIWQEVLSGQLNLSVALRRNELRYCDFGENDFFVTEARTALLAAVLGLPGWAGDPAAAGSVPALAG
jgi:sulfotransferase family protein